MPVFSAHIDLHLNEHFADQVDEAIQKGMADGFAQMVRVAARMSPYLTGNNARLISWTTNWGEQAGNSHTPSGQVIRKKGHLSGAIFTQSGYGGYLELGTSRMAARPYIRPAVEQEGQYMVERIKYHIQHAHSLIEKVTEAGG
jgi:HK97 gp10 family phage protein